MAYLQAFLIIASGIAITGIFYLLMQYLEEERGKTDLIAGVKTSEYNKNVTNQATLNFKPAAKMLTHGSTKPSLRLVIFGLIWSLKYLTCF